MEKFTDTLLSVLKKLDNEVQIFEQDNTKMEIPFIMDLEKFKNSCLDEDGEDDGKTLIWINSLNSFFEKVPKDEWEKQAELISLVLFDLTKKHLNQEQNEQNRKKPSVVKNEDIKQFKKTLKHIEKFITKGIYNNDDKPNIEDIPSQEQLKTIGDIEYVENDTHLEYGAKLINKQVGFTLMHNLLNNTIEAIQNNELNFIYDKLPIQNKQELKEILTELNEKYKLKATHLIKRFIDNLN